MTPWILLFVAGLFEIGWPLGFKLSQTTQFRITFVLVACISMILSVSFLYLAQRSIPIGTSYAVWTGIGAIGTFIIGVLFFGDPAKLIRFLSIMLIVIGIVGLKLGK